MSWISPVSIGDSSVAVAGKHRPDDGGRDGAAAQAHAARNPAAVTRMHDIDAPRAAQLTDRHSDVPAAVHDVGTHTM